MDYFEKTADKLFDIFFPKDSGFKSMDVKLKETFKKDVISLLKKVAKNSRDKCIDIIQNNACVKLVDKNTLILDIKIHTSDSYK